jgi:O-antigen ligase
VLLWFLAGWLIIFGLTVSDLFRGNTLENILKITGQYFWSYLVIPCILFAQPLEVIRSALFAFLWGFFISVALGMGIAVVNPAWYQAMTVSEIFAIEDRVGSFLGPNAQAKLSAMFLPLVIAYIARRESFIWLWRLWITVIAVGLLGAASFAGLFSAVVALLGVVLLMPRLFMKTFIWIAVLTVLLIVFVLLVAPLRPGNNLEAALTRLTKPFETNSLEAVPSFQIRFQLMQEALEQIHRSPIVGLGAGKYQQYSTFQISVHNTYLLLWSEGGILSFVGILLFVLVPLVFTLVHAFRYFPKQGMDLHRAIYLCYGIGILVFSLNIFSNTYSFSRYTVVPMLLLAIISFRSADSREIYAKS